MPSSGPLATIRQFIEGWLKTKKPDVSAATLAFYLKSTFDADERRTRGPPHPKA